MGRNRGSRAAAVGLKVKKKKANTQPQTHREEEARKRHKAGRAGRGKLTTVCLTSQDFKSCSYLPNPCSPTILQPPHCFNLALLTSKHICSPQRAWQTLSQASCSLLPSFTLPLPLCLSPWLTPTRHLPCHLLDTELFFSWLSREIQALSLFSKQ